MQYTFARSQMVTWQPQFTYMGFRYALRCSGRENRNWLTYRLRAAQRHAAGGFFTCSNRW